MKYKYDKYGAQPIPSGKSQRCDTEENGGCEQLKPIESFVHGYPIDRHRLCGVCAMKAPGFGRQSDKRAKLRNLYDKHKLWNARKDTS